MRRNPTPVIAVFGGSQPPPDSPEYAEAYRIGGLLACAGWTVMNGGYGGTMQASARGARENGGRTIGVLSGEFDRLAPNGYLDQTVRSEDLFARIREMHIRADAFVVLKGSIGTLAELALVWNLAKVGAWPPKPIVLVGAGWKSVLESWGEHLAVTGEELALLHAVDRPEEAVDYLRGALSGESHPSPRAPSSHV
jgi:uncharacterized protein (TIGR00730 family)